MKKVYALVFLLALIVLIAVGAKADTTDDMVPRIAVRFDDGLDDLYNERLWEPFSDFGIPVSFALHADKLSTGATGYMTTAQMKEILGEMRSRWEICTHTNNNWNSANPQALTYGQILAELNASPLEDMFREYGINVTYFAEPGEPANKTFVRRHRNMIQKELRKQGILYWDGAYGDQDSSSTLANWVPNASFVGATNPTYDSSSGVRPGMEVDPLWMKNAITVDLGNFYTERIAQSVNGKPVDRWLALENSKTLSDWKESFSYLTSKLIANGKGAVFAMHDSTTAQFSYKIAAKRLYDLEQAGFIKLVTVSEFAKWATSSIEPGTELMWKPDFEIPGIAIGDTMGIEFGWGAGWGAVGSASSSWDANESSNWPAGSNGKFDRTDVGHPESNYPLDGFKGYPSALNMSATSRFMKIARTGLPAGRYRLSVGMSDPNIQVRNFSVAVSGQYESPQGRNTWASPAWGDTLLVQWGRGSVSTLTLSGTDPLFETDFRIDPSAIVPAGPSTTVWYGSASYQGDWQGGFFIEFGGGPTQFGGGNVQRLGPVSLVYLGE